MSEFFLIIIWFAVVAMLYRSMPAANFEYVCGMRVSRPKWFYAVLLFAPVVYMVATRSNAIGDTYAYEVLYKALPATWSELVAHIPTVTKDKGFTLLSGVVKLIFGDSTRIYFFILALIQGLALIYVYRKYSYNYFISMFLFIASTDYLSWMYNGIRQFTAVTIIFAATPLMLKKKWIPLVAVILLASTIHGSALLMLPIVFIVQGKAWNGKTLVLTVACVIAFAFADQFTNVLDTLLSDTQYTNVVSDWQGMNDDGTNMIRVIVYSVPALLSFIGRKWIDYDNDPVINLCTNMSIVSAALYLVSAGTSGVFLGRLPIFTSLYGYILLPYLLDRIFTKDSARVMKLLMIGTYLVFYYYQIHFAWGLV
ncbi:MAG: EpsG family protein [Lachnospiraceae bacterium]|nr:EpsG family protein [Lachnospiraceae bacterium]